MSTDSALDESTPRRLGKYELQERLGQGEIAEVWKALDTQLQRPVALKLLHADLQNDADFLTRFLREIRVMASLHHPNIAQIYDFQVSRPPIGAMASPDPHNTPAYMVMEYIDGQTLANFLAQTSQRGNVPAPEAIVGLFSAIGRALDYAHARGMIHGDLKPTNILLDQRNMLQNSMGEPVLTDFGLVTLLDSSTPTRRGLNPYNAPEQAQGIVNQRSDIYSHSE